MENRIFTVLSLPLVERVQELTLIIQRCSIKELEDIFPILVKSIFEDQGWHLRLITRERNQVEFEWLFSFLYPMGHMFDLCYKLLIDAIKFDVPLTNLPPNMQQMLESGRSSFFYADLIRVNPLTRQITHISLNAFDYYMLHFAIHGQGISKLHNNLALANIYAEKLTTVYFSLAAEYISWFLPSNPVSQVLPPNIGGTVKVNPPAMQINNPKRPLKSPTYFKLSALNRQLPGLPNSRVAGGSVTTLRNSSWRSESVLYLFIDIWLRENFELSIDLPSVEFMLLVRVLVKQVHAFGNAADIDNTAMAELRKLAQPMLCGHMFHFFHGLISRWPLDGSFQCVLELYLSYIQPWRYTHDRDYSNRGRTSEIVITPRYETYIQENIRDYTQIFLLMMPRFQQFDYSSYRDVLMLYRLIKVFGQPRLVSVLRRCENYYVSTLSPRKDIKTASMHKATDSSDNVHGYVLLFNQSPQMEEIVDQLLRRVRLAEYLARNEMALIDDEEKRNNTGFWNNLKLLFMFSDLNSLEGKSLRERRRIPDILSAILETCGTIFNIDVQNISVDDQIVQPQCQELNMFQNESMSTLHNSSNTLLFNGTIPSPALIRSRVPVYRGDPALLPIQNNEVRFLVRFLYRVCEKVNGILEDDLNRVWTRQDMVGKLVRPLLEPPMTAETFERHSGYINLRYEQLGPRIHLRTLASYYTLCLIAFAMLFGHFFFRLPSVGILILLVILYIYRFWMVY